jgi:hypothetical protein
MTEWLHFASTLIWQLIVVGVVCGFRKQIASLIEKLSTIKTPIGEATFQKPALEAVKPGGTTDEQLKLVEPQGFFTEQGIRKLVEDSGLTEASEHVRQLLLIYRNSQQRTWLVATDLQLFCILDDEDMRSRGTLVQWHIPLAEAKPIRVRPYDKADGLLDVGNEKTDWFYSRSLFPDSRKLRRVIEEMIEAVKP